MSKKNRNQVLPGMKAGQMPDFGQLLSQVRQVFDLKAQLEKGQVTQGEAIQILEGLQKELPPVETTATQTPNPEETMNNNQEQTPITETTNTNQETTMSETTYETTNAQEKTTMKEKLVNATKTVKDSTVQAACAVGSTTVKAAGAVKEKAVKTKDEIVDMIRDFQQTREKGKMEAILQAVSLMNRPSRVIMMTVLKRTLLPRDWKEATGMILGGGAGAGLAYLLDASTGGMVFTGLVTAGSIKGLWNFFKEDEVLSANLEAFKLQIVEALAARAERKAAKKAKKEQVVKATFSKPVED